jgi:transposase
MEHYVGLDVSLKLTVICIVDQTGRIEREGVVASNPEAIAAFIKSHAPHIARIRLETGATSTWLWAELNKMGLPVICNPLQEVEKRRSLRRTDDPTIRIRRGRLAGRISKCGDKLLRSYLYEAANMLLTRVAKWSAVKAWGIRLAKRSGLRKAKVAVARKLAVILHRMWIDGTGFNWSTKKAAA